MTMTIGTLGPALEPVRTTPSVLVPVSLLEQLADAADKAAIHHHHKVADTWPEGVPCRVCTPRTEARRLIEWAR